MFSICAKIAAAIHCFSEDTKQKSFIYLYRNDKQANCLYHLPNKWNRCSTDEKQVYNYHPFVSINVHCKSHDLTAFRFIFGNVIDLPSNKFINIITY